MNKAVEENNLKIVITIFSRFMCTTIIFKKLNFMVLFYGQD